MKTVPRAASDDCASYASVEGYLALVLVVLSFLAGSVDHPTEEMVVFGAVFTGVTYGLALGGVRFGRGVGRVAAWVVLVYLSLYLFLVLAACFVRWLLIGSYWRH